ncbi:MAG: NAD(P)H-hydrate dehydratase [Eubacterium sp.]|nr:NAD(P)H-hydrate dehydratase [Eubacterium sp.]
MRILTAEEIKKVEKSAVEKGFSVAELMNRAGRKCVDKIVKFYGKEIEGNKILVFCGNGKNAGDGFVIAKRLCHFGNDAEIVLCDKEPTLEVTKKYFDEAVESGVKVTSFADCDMNCAVIVDCIFGIGFHGEPKEPFNSVFNAINESDAIVVSVDTPSGTNATDGSVVNAVQADLTIAISSYKYCHVLPPANAYCGKIVSVNIGIPNECFDGDYASTITKAYVKRCFEKRNLNSNKGDFGKQLNICGSYKMPGASVICAKAALKTGVGLLKCAFPKSVYGVLTAHLTQPIFAPMSENEDKTFSMGALTEVLNEIKWADSIALGCGIAVNDDTQLIVNQVIKESNVPVVVDADGINCLSVNIDVLRDSKAPIILTPHPGEMARLIHQEVSFVQENRIDCAKSFAKEHGCIVVLKGANTVVTDGVNAFVNTTGNPGMAMGGTGDMLTGMIASFIAQGLTPFDAAVSGVYIHGLCGDITAREISQRGMTVDNMLELLGALMIDFE